MKTTEFENKDSDKDCVENLYELSWNRAIMDCMRLFDDDFDRLIREYEKKKNSHGKDEHRNT